MAGRFPPPADDETTDVGPPSTDEDDMSMQILDDLQAWLDQKRAESELGPLKKKPGEGTSPSPLTNP